MLKSLRFKPGKRLGGLMLLWAVLIPIGVVLSACGGSAPTIVTFPDERLEAVIKRALDKPPGEEIRAGELAQLTELDAGGRGIADLTGIEHLSSLTRLDLVGNQISDISFLASLSNLTELYLGVNQISAISPLASLSNLFFLGLSENQISDISPLAPLSNLSFLDLSENQISNISSLASLSDLTHLDLRENPISDISPLVENSGLGQADAVYLADNKLDLSEGSEQLENIRKLEERGVEVR